MVAPNRKKPRQPKPEKDVTERLGGWRKKDHWRKRNLPQNSADYEPSEEERILVTCASMNGVPIDNIASIMGMDQVTLRKHFQFELDYATDDIISRATGILYHKVFIEKDSKSLFFLLQTRGNFRVREERKPSEEQKDAVVETFDFSDLTEEERLALRQILSARVQTDGGATRH